MTKMIGYSKMPDNSGQISCRPCRDDGELKNGDKCQECCNHFFVGDVDGLPTDEPCRKCGIDFNDLPAVKQSDVYRDIQERLVCASEQAYDLSVGK